VRRGRHTSDKLSFAALKQSSRQAFHAARQLQRQQFTHQRAHVQAAARGQGIGIEGIVAQRRQQRRIALRPRAAAWTWAR